ncbi:MAG: NADPH-dependent FMN reductase, partial [Paracoccaceae bacterium]
AEGRAGGERAQFSLRLCLNPFRARVLPGPEVMIAKSRTAFDAAGRLNDLRDAEKLGELIVALKAAVLLQRYGAGQSDVHV